MPITSSDILFKLSTTAGTAGNQNAQSNPNASLGKYISTTQVSGTALNNLFDDVSGPENSAGDTEYRCIFIHNAHASLTYYNPVVYISNETSGGASIAIGVDTTAASPIGSSSAQALQVADENTAPSGVTFSSPTTLATGLELGDIPAGYCKAIWLKRTVNNVAALNNDSVTLTVAGGTAA